MGGMGFFLFLPLLLILSVRGIAPLSISSILWVWLCCRTRCALPAPHIPVSVIPCANPKCYPQEQSLKPDCNRVTTMKEVPDSLPNWTYSRGASSDEVLWLTPFTWTPRYLSSHTSLFILPLISVSAQYLCQQGSSSFEISKGTSLALYGWCWEASKRSLFGSSEIVQSLPA